MLRTTTLIALVSTLSCPVAAQTASWILRSSAGPQPGPFSAAATDFPNGEVLLFGGGPLTGTSETWAWRTGSWTQRTPATTPAARWAHAMTDFQFGPPPLPATVLLIDTNNVRTWGHGLSASSVGYGTGCPYQGSTPTLMAPPPLIGTNHTFQLGSLPANQFAVLFTSTQIDPAGTPLSGSSCLVYVVPPLDSTPVVYTAPGSSSATATIAIPNNPSLIGTVLYHQGWITAPGVNPANAVTTNALCSRIG